MPSRLRKGSMEFWPHRRAKKQMPRVRTWSRSAEPGFLGSIAFKAGMTHIMMMDDSASPAKGTEIARAVTVLEIPKVYIYGVRLYGKKYLYTQPAAESYDAALAKRVGINEAEQNLDKLKSDTSNFIDASALAFMDASNLGFGNKRVMRFEVAVGGKDVNEKIGFLEKWIGKEIIYSAVMLYEEFVGRICGTDAASCAGVVIAMAV